MEKQKEVDNVLKKKSEKHPKERNNIKKQVKRNEKSGKHLPEKSNMK